MYRLLAVGFSVVVILLSLLAVVQPAGALSIFMNTHGGAAVLRVILCLVLLMYSLRPDFRYDLPRKTLALASIGLAWFFVATLITENTPFPEPLDLFFGIEGGVLAAIAALEFERPKTVRKFMPHMEWVGTLMTLVQQLRPTLPPSQQKPA